MTATADTTAWGRIGLVYAAGVLGAMQTGLIAGTIPALQRDLDLSLPFVGWVLSAITAVATVLGTVAGAWTDRVGLARSIKMGLAMMAAVAVLGAVANDGATLLASRVILGIGYLGTVVAGPPLIARLARPHDRAFALALWGAFVPVGIAVAEGLVGVFFDTLGWRGLFWGNAALLALACLAASIVLREVSGPANAARRPAFWHVYRLRRPMLLMTAFFTFTFSFTVLAGLEPTFLIEGRGLSPGAAVRIVAIGTLFAIPGSLLAGWLIRRGLAPMPLALLSLAVPAVSGAMVFLPGLSIGVVAGATVVTFLVGGMMPAATYALLPHVAPEPHQFAPVNGLLTQLGSGGSLLGPPVFAAWSASVGWSWGWLPLVAIAVAGIACLIGIRRTVP